LRNGFYDGRLGGYEPGEVMTKTDESKRKHGRKLRSIGIVNHQPIWRLKDSDGNSWQGSRESIFAEVAMAMDDGIKRITVTRLGAS
jgi:hypothetical protein